MRSLICFSILLFIFLFPLAIAQSSIRILDGYRKAEQLYNLENPTDETDRKALQFYLNAAKQLVGLPKYDSVTFDCYLKAGILQQSATQQQQSIRSFMSANSILERSSLADSFRFKPYLFIGTAYYALNNFDSASYYFKEAEQLVNKYPRISEQERLYNKTGTMYYESGNYLQSRFYFEKALATLDTTATSNQYLFVNYKNNIASAFRKLHEYGSALNIYESLLPYGIEKDGLLQNIGDTYLAMGEYAKAIYYINATSFSNPKKSNDLAFAYLRLRRIDSAAYYINDALQNQLAQSQKSVTKGITFSYLAELNVLQKNLPAALNYYQQAIIQMDPDFNDERINSNPLQFEGLHSYSNLFEAITHKANTFSLLIDSTKKKQDLVNAVNTMKSAFLLSDNVAETYGSDEARLFLSDNLQPAYQTYLDWCIQLYETTHDASWLKEAVVMAEKSKASVLQSSLLQFPLLNIKGIPHDLLQQEKNLKAAINRYNLLMSGTTDSVQSIILHEKLLTAEIELSKVHEKLNDQPAYSSLWQTENVDIENIQNELTSKEAVLSFYFSSSNLFGFLITGDTLIYQKLAASSSIVNEERSLMAQLNQVSTDPKQLSKMQEHLYAQLIQPFLPYIEKKDRLTIVPHNELAYLPFEVLMDDKKRYLLENFSVTYDYSLALLHPASSSESNDLLVAFAPFAEKEKLSGEFAPIPASRTEVSALEGKIFFDSAATKQEFLKLSSQMGIAHLATHAAANDSFPLESYIAFYPSGHDTAFKLFEPEIYNLDLRASKLVVLSACETGAGKLIHGEGLLSLSRAFSYAGCPSIITSLWKADDVSTAYICKRLHHYLSKGLEKDIALQRAKQDYLDDGNISQQFKLPRFWANLVLVGDNSPVYHRSLISIISIVALLGILIIILIIAATRYKKKRSSLANRGI